jgi:hypothetical protein
MASRLVITSVRLQLGTIVSTLSILASASTAYHHGVSYNFYKDNDRQKTANLVLLVGAISSQVITHIKLSLLEAMASSFPCGFRIQVQPM